MPPADSQRPANPDYDFILKDQQKSGSGFKLPNFSNGRLPFLILGGLIVLIFLIIIVSSFFKGGGVNSEDLISAMAKAQEIARVSTLADQQTSADTGVHSTALTTVSSLSSDQAQLTSYLTSNGHKVGAKELAVDLDKSTDTAMQTAASNGSLAGFYYSYLKKNLADYQNKINEAYKTSPTNARVILKTAYDSTTVILASPQLK